MVQSLFDTRGRYIPISCNSKAQKTLWQRKYTAFTRVKCKMSTSENKTHTTDNKFKQLFKTQFFEISISSFQIQLPVSHTQTCSEFSVFGFFPGLLQSLQSCRRRPSSFNTTCCPVCSLCSIFDTLLLCFLSCSLLRAFTGLNLFAFRFGFLCNRWRYLHSLLQ